MGDKDGVVDQAQFHFTRSLTKKYGSFEEAAGKVQAKNGKKLLWLTHICVITYGFLTEGLWVLWFFTVS
jgi:hypothetical protein